MALIPCLECRKDVSTRAAACPHCGAPVAFPTPAGPPPPWPKEKTRTPLWLLVLFVIGGVLVVLVVIGIAVTPTPPAPTSVTGITIGSGCGRATVDMLDGANAEAANRGASRRVESVYCEGDGSPRRVWLTGSVPWTPNEGTGRLMSRLLAK